MSRLLPVILLLGTGCGASRAITGTITDADGRPLDRAIVSMEPGGVQLVTNREGEFVIDYLRDESSDRTALQKKQTYTLDVYKPGFSIQQLDLYYKGGEHIVAPIALSTEQLSVQDDGQNLVPSLELDRTSTGGATYEGQ